MVGGNFLDRLWGKNTDATTDVMPEQVMGFWRSLWQAIQHLLTASGANVVGPILMHVPVSMALFTSGIGTIIYCWLVGVPAYMGTSFAFIGPIANTMTASWGGPGAVAGGIIVAGITSVILGLIVRLAGYRWINILMPAVVLAMTVIAIGVVLAPVAYAEFISDLFLGVLTLALGIIFATKFRQGHIINALPILLSITIVYILALIMGKVDLTDFNNAPLFVWPTMVKPVFDPRAYVPMILITVTALLMESIGHLKGTSAIVGRDYMPKTWKNLVADGLANIASFSGTPSTSYGENMGVFAITKIYSLRVMFVAGVLAIGAGFLGKLTPLVQSIPKGILGGATFLLFGMIGWAGFNLLQTELVDLKKRSNQVVVACMSTMIVAGTIVEYLRNNFGSMTAADISGASSNLAPMLIGLRTYMGSLDVLGFAVPAVVAVAVLGIVLNLVLNYTEIRQEIREMRTRSVKTAPATTD